MKIARPDDNFKLDGNRELTASYGKEYQRYDVKRPIKYKPVNSFHEIMDAYEDEIDKWVSVKILCFDIRLVSRYVGIILKYVWNILTKE